MSDSVKITAVEPYKGRTVRVSIEAADPVFMDVSTVDSFSLRAGMILPLSAWEQVTAEELFRKARERALYLLDRRDYGYVEMYRKLEAAYGEDIAFRVMDKLVDIGVINDARYAEGLARHYAEVKGFGPMRASREMRAKGLTAQVVKNALEEYDQDFWYERLRSLVEKKFLRKLFEDRGEDKVRNSLLRYGYSYGLIKDVLRDVREEYPDEE